MPILRPQNKHITVNATGNTTASTSGTQNVSNMVIAGAGNVSVGISNSSIVISGGTAGDGYNIIAAGTQTANTTGTVVFSNSHNISFGLTNNSIVTASASYSQSTAPAAISAGTQILSSGTLIFSNSNGVSFGLNGATLTATVKTDYLTSQTVQTQNMVSVLGSTGDISFANSNGITFGGNAGTVTASHNGLTSQSNQALSGSNGSFTFQTATFGNLNGLSFYTSNGSMVGSYTVPNVPAQTVQTIGGYAEGNTTGQSSSSTFDARSISYSGLGNISVGYSDGKIIISGSGGGAGDGYNIIAAGTQTANTTGTVVFSNSHNVSFGMSNNSIVTASASYSQSTAPAAISAGTTQATNGTVVFSNANGISFGMDAGTVTASHNGLTSQSNQALSGSNGSFAFQTATFGNLNGLSFYTSNGSMVGSYTVPNVPAQTVQTIGGYAVGNTTGESSSSTFDARTLSLNGAGLVSVGYSNSSIIISATQTVQTQNIVAPAAGTQTATSGTVVFSNSNGVSFGMSGSTRITATIDAIKSISAGTTRATNGEVVWSNANGVSFGVDGNTVTASHNALTSQSNQALSGSNGSFTFQTATFGNLNGLSFYTSNGSMVGSYTVPNVPAQTVQTIGMYAVGNTTGQSSSSTFDARTISISGLGNASVGYSGSNIIISVSGAGAGDGYNIIAAGTQTANTTGTVVFSNSHNISFGMSNNSVVTASASYSQSTAPAAISAGTTQATNGTVVFSNANGISFGMDAGTVTASYTVPTQSVQTLGLYAEGNTTGQSSSSSFDARSISYSGLGNISVGYSANKVVVSGTQTVQTQNLHNVTLAGNSTSAGAGFIQISSGTMTLAGGNNITLSQNGNAVTISAFTQTVQTQNIVVPGAGTQTATSGTVVWSNSNGVSFGMSGSTRITASIDAIKSVSAGTTRATNGEVVWSNSNGISFGVNGNTVTASYTVPTQTVQTIGLYAVGNTTGQSSSSTYDARSISFDGAGIISLGNSGGTFRISATQSNQQLSLYAVSNTTQSSSGTANASNMSFHGAGIASVGISNGSVVVSVPAGGGAGDGYNIIAAGTQTANTTGTVVFSNSHNVSFGMSNNSVVTASARVPGIHFVSPPWGAGIGTLITNATAVTQRPILLPFNVNGDLTANVFQWQMSRSTSGSNNFSVQFGIYSYVNNTQISLIASTSVSYSATATASVSGIRLFNFPLGTDLSTLSAGQYVAAIIMSATATASMNYSFFGAATGGPATTGILPGANQYLTATSYHQLPFWGRYTTTTGGLPGSIAQTHVIGGWTGASQPLPINFTMHVTA